MPGRSGKRRFDDPVAGRPWTFRQIVQGLIDNFLGHESEWRWRLNDEVPVPADVHPLKNPGLELTGPWHPLDMAFNALNSAAPDEHAGLRRRFAGALSGARHHQAASLSSNIRGPAQRERDPSGRLGRQVVRGRQEGQYAILQNRPNARPMADAASPSAQHSHCCTNTSSSMARPRPG